MRTAAESDDWYCASSTTYTTRTCGRERQAPRAGRLRRRAQRGATATDIWLWGEPEPPAAVRREPGLRRPAAGARRAAARTTGRPLTSSGTSRLLSGEVEVNMPFDEDRS